MTKQKTFSNQKSSPRIFRFIKKPGEPCSPLFRLIDDEG